MRAITLNLIAQQPQASGALKYNKRVAQIAPLAMRFIRHRTDSDEIKAEDSAPGSGPEMVQRIWGSSGFYARIDNPSPSANSDQDGSHWCELYRGALLELDLGKLAERVEAAEKAIRARASLNGRILSDERIAIQDAMSALNVLKAAVKRNRPETE